MQIADQLHCRTARSWIRIKSVMNTTSDFQIVGGGINGLLLAHELAAAGASVTVVEKGQPGREASWAGGGIVSPLYPWRYDSAITALASWAQDYYPRLAAQLYDETELDIELHTSGLLMLDAEDRVAALDWAHQFGRKMAEIGVDEIYKLEESLARGFKHGLWMPEVANVRNPRLLQALIVSLERRKNVQILASSEVVAWECDKSVVRQMTLRDSETSRCIELPVSQLIVCAGAWSGRLLAGLNTAIGVHPVKGQMLLYKFAKPPIDSIVLTQGRYLIPRHDGHLLAGSTLEYEDFDKTPSMQARQSLQHSAESLLPQLKGQQPIAQWAGLRPGSGDGIPFIGRVGDWQNLHINAGQFRNGLVLAPASSRLMADLLLLRKPIIDPAPYDPCREQESCSRQA